MMSRSSGKIGLLWPADGLNDPEFWQWLPNDASLLIARYEVGGSLNLEQLEQDAKLGAILGAAALLRHVQPGVIAMGDCAGSFINGKAGNLRQTVAVEEATGISAITMSSAIVEALRSLGASHVAVLSPYAPEVTERFDWFLTDHDIAVEASLSVSRASELEIDAMSLADWKHQAQQADINSAQAIAVAGGGVSLSAIIGELENELGKPVITGPGALMWAALRRLGAIGARDDRGALFKSDA